MEEPVVLTVHANSVVETEAALEYEANPLLPLPMRVMQSFEVVQDTNFWPSEVTSVVSNLMAPSTFEEFRAILNNTTSNSINSMDQTIQAHNKNYRGYLSELDKTPNVFSFDVDYI
ncbi:hypothetical protein ACQVWE_13310 [Bacillus cereus]|uniref:hypothetical protein n=1 Tax=Bacillus cereus group TaxID=86661 RepID=UPI000BFA79BB|nr:hypothetical protein [Bacillus cereus]PFB64294.1 hypothetical protein CN291_16430 [Bacillus cereus]PGT10145.1 hypothetical protein COD03_20455 [Bacillus cereus]